MSISSYIHNIIVGELVTFSSRGALAAAVLIKLAGPMIRLLSQNLDNDVKIALLETLGTVIHKGGVGVKPLVSQLQTTFVRQLQSNNHTVRNLSAALLGKIMPLTIRVDPLVNELVNTILEGGGGRDVKIAVMEALRRVLKGAGDKVKSSKAVLEGMMNVACEYDDEEEEVRIKASQLYGAAFISLSREEGVDTFTSLLDKYKLTPSTSPTTRQGLLLCIAACK